jgi:hypothetical protein
MSVSSTGANPTATTNDRSDPNSSPLVPNGQRPLNGEFPALPLPIYPIPTINTYSSKAELDFSKKSVDNRSIPKDELSSSNPRLANIASSSIGSSDSSTNFSHQFSRFPTLTSDTTPLVSTTTNQVNHNDFAINKNIKNPYQLVLNELYDKAINGNKNAENILGYMLNMGIGTAKNDHEAINWYSKAANQGFIPAQLNLARMYQSGSGTPKNDIEAEKWFRRAAQQGNHEAQFKLGVACFFGQGIKQNYVDGANWFLLSAKQGNAGAQFNLGLAIHNGHGVKKSYEDAAKWFLESAEQGNAGAQLRLGSARFGMGIRFTMVMVLNKVMKMLRNGFLSQQKMVIHLLSLVWAKCMSMAKVLKKIITMPRIGFVNQRNKVMQMPS